ncbi:twin-arginine translocase TatA/TatE family subunit [Deinococcus aestuarii]|uniref:twin-arginine translocase TatA/TatE family subunit n=1 Tax=Deinococcus aestuarii TaxID=2774531 RepID=UPI001C0C083D|nr:twin-arginine translocase TatA/TatE family subunit [Deinococcus aestuarii]
MNLGPMEIILVVIALALVFGPKKLPELGRGLGQSVREFRSGTRELRRDLDLTGADQEKRR